MSISQSSHAIDFEEISSDQACLTKKRLLPTESCIDQWKVSTVNQEDQYQGKVVYSTNLGSIEAPIQIVFKSPTDPIFQRDRFTISSMTPIAVGETTRITLSNSTQHAINHPVIEFPKGLKPFITDVSTVTEIKSGQSAIMSFKVVDSKEAQQALKAWQDDLNANKDDVRLKYSSARFSTQIYPLQPTIYLSDLVIQKPNAQNFREIDGKLAMDISILNVSQDSMTKLTTDIIKGSEYITVDHSKCHLPLQKNNSCIVTISVDPAISNAYAADQIFDVIFKVNDQSNREPSSISFYLDMNANVALGLQSTLTAQHENQIYLQNNSLIEWIPSHDIQDYKIIDGTINDITSEFIIGNGIKSPDCLTINSVAKNTGCYITVLPSTDQTGKQLKLHLDHSNVQSAALLLPDYSINGMSGNTALTPSTVIKGRDLSIYFTIAPPSAKTFKDFELVGIASAIQDTSYPNSCKQGDVVSSDNPCQLKIDIAGEDIDGENFKPQLVVLWQDATQSTVELNIEVVDPTQPGEDVSGLSDVKLLQSQTNYVDINQNGIQIFIKNTTGKVLSALNIHMLPQWLNDLVDLSQLEMITLSPDQETIVNIPLKTGKSANDLSAALRAHLDEITHNDRQDETGGQVIRFTSSNALDDYFPKIKVDTIPYFDTEGFNDKNNKQTLTYTMVFGQPNQQYIEVKNPTDYRYDISFTESLPSGITRVMSGTINGLTNCSEFPILLTGEKCVVAFMAAPDANVAAGDHFDLIMTPAEGDVTSTTTLQMNFKVNYVYDIAYQTEGGAIAIPLSGNKLYNLKLVNNEKGIQWVPSTNTSDYVVSHDQGVTGLSITTPTIMPSCMDGVAVATDAYCYIGLDVNDSALTQSNYQLSLKMGESNLALDVLDVGQVSLVEYGKASVQLAQNGHSIGSVIRSGEIVDIVITPPENWHVAVDDDQSFSVSANHPSISFPQGNICTLSQTTPSTECKVSVQIDQALESGNYHLMITPEAQTMLPLNLSQLDLGVSSVKYTLISSFNSHVCALDDKDNAYCWGRNFNGQLGIGENYEYSLEPLPVTLGEAPAGNKWQNIAAGFYHTCALNQLGDVYCWGANYKGELGNGSFQESNVPRALAQGDIPVGVKLTDIKSGASFSCAIGTDKNVYCWGDNQNGVLGAGSIDSNSNVPVKVDARNIPLSAEIESISLGNNHACLLTDTKEVFCWGSNYNGQLGTQLPVNSSNMPVKVDLAGVIFKNIYTGHYHTCGLSDQNKAYCWGSNDNGQLGTGVMPSLGESIPKKLESGSMPEGETIESMTLGNAHSCAVASNHKVYCWGLNRDGLLGNGVEVGSYENKPIAIVQGDIPEGGLISSMAAGSSHTCILSKGYDYCWGRNTNGQLGNGTLNNSLTPVVGKLPTVNLTN